MPAIKKILSFSTFMAVLVLVFAVMSLSSPVAGPKVYADPSSCAAGFHAVGGKCVKTDASHPVSKSSLRCASDQTPTKITKGADAGKWYCKDKPSGSPSGPKSAPAATACNLDNGCDLVNNYVNPFINFLSVAFGLIAVISIILGGIQYSTSQGDPQKSAQAKSRISNTLLAVFAYLFLYAFLQFLIPGGLFN